MLPLVIVTNMSEPFWKEGMSEKKSTYMGRLITVIFPSFSVSLKTN